MADGEERPVATRNLELEREAQKARDHAVYDAHITQGASWLARAEARDRGGRGIMAEVASAAAIAQAHIALARELREEAEARGAWLP